MKFISVWRKPAQKHLTQQHTKTINVNFYCLLCSGLCTDLGAEYTGDPSAGVFARWLKLAEPKSESFCLPLYIRSGLFKEDISTTDIPVNDGGSLSMEISKSRCYISKDWQFTFFFQYPLFIGRTKGCCLKAR